ncbi:peptide-binding protein [Sorangium cellulosum]|uniref:Peptide-binding protein n=1 Tax=Sorangium cellulosum TaxID=56 RepID=A0A4P2PYQ3_SORCE|nr:SH3 domain-containing protein [Sorangium cellulosum]AUX21920.1 peptide-binding protein [Sorangium cellulosum]
MNIRPILPVLFVVALPSVARAEILSVNVPVANFRAGPSTSEPVEFTATRYYPVKVLDREDGWCKIKDFEGDLAWVADRLLAKIKTIVIKVPRGNVREEPTTSAEVAFQAERGEVFKVLERKGRWLHVVDVEGEKGWVREDLAWGTKKVGNAGGSS